MSIPWTTLRSTLAGGPGLGKQVPQSTRGAPGLDSQTWDTGHIDRPLSVRTLSHLGSWPGHPHLSESQKLCPVHRALCDERV